MDQSPAYIHMCAKAETLQKSWQPVHGDVYVSEDGRVAYWIDTCRPVSTVKGGFGVRCQDGVIHLVKYTWLPRLDQLIAMAQVPHRSYDATSCDFFSWAKGPYRGSKHSPRHLFQSLEQLWLGFVMQNKYGRRWDGTSWRFPAH